MRVVAKVGRNKREGRQRRIRCERVVECSTGCRATGLAISTIRYYEQEGLLDERHFVRLANGYRSYTKDAIERLRHFKQARMTGLTIAEIKTLTKAHENNNLTDEQWEVFLREKIHKLTLNIDTLLEIRAGLEAELQNCELRVRHSSSA